MPRSPTVIPFPTTRRPPETALNVTHLLRPAAPVSTSKDIVDLTGTRTALLVNGDGHTGKTTFLRWACERALARETGFELSLAACDPINRALLGYFPGSVMSPNTPDTKGWLNLYLSLIMSGKGGCAVDFGGGNTVLLDLVQDSPVMGKTMQVSGLEPVLVMLLSPRVGDLTLLEALDQAHFQPRATLLVLNLGRGDASEFDAIREHSVYQAAVGRGAAEVWMPKNHAARMVEEWGLGFAAAVGDERLAMLDRSRVKVWLEQMEEAFAGVGSWLP